MILFKSPHRLGPMWAGDQQQQSEGKAIGDYENIALYQPRQIVAPRINKDERGRLAEEDPPPSRGAGPEHGTRQTGYRWIPGGVPMG
jgi:hypothetical protein